MPNPNTILKRDAQTQIEELSESFLIENCEEVAEFIVKNSELKQVLKEAVLQIKKYFQDNFSYLRLHLVHDPEVIGYEELAVYIATKIPLVEAKKLYDNFSDDWWLEKFVEVEGSLSINIELI